MAERPLHDATEPTPHDVTPTARADEQAAVHACAVCAVEHPPNDPACRCPDCICEECKPNECPCAGAGERARDDHDRGLFTDPLSLFGGWRLPTAGL